MNLQEFVTQTLVQIVAGVADAKKQVEELNVGAAINPESTWTGENRSHATANDVEFDVAVTVASSERAGDETRAGAAAGGVLAVVGLKISGSVSGRSEDERREEAVSRVRFRVKLGQPGVIKERPPMRVNY